MGTFLVTLSLQISKLKVNEISEAPNGDCTGTQFSELFGAWNNVVVQAITF